MKGKGGHKFEWNCGGNFHLWNPVGKKQVPEWIDATDLEVKKSQKIIKTNRLVTGTNWENPLEMAFSMEPPPNAIIFMTDGVASGDPVAIASKYAKMAKKKGILINSIALMEPRAAEAMEVLAKGTGGEFSLIGADGKKTNVRKGGKKPAKKK